MTDIGYLLEEGPDFQVATANVDAEIARVAGPQLVVPITNARYALNAANARFGSLYDALYGTDVIPQTSDKAQTSGYDATRGQKVIAYVRKTLDKATPLANASWSDVTNLAIVDGALEIECGGSRTTLADANTFTGYTGDVANTKSIILTNNELHLQIMIDHAGAIGQMIQPVSMMCSPRRRFQASWIARTQSPRLTRRTKFSPMATGTS